MTLSIDIRVNGQHIRYLPIPKGKSIIDSKIGMCAHAKKYPEVQEAIGKNKVLREVYVPGKTISFMTEK